MTKSATLSFRTNFHSQELSTLELPVVIRDNKLQIVARALTTQQLAIEPGEYFISCRLPAGQELQTHIKVGEGETQAVDLSPNSSDSSPSENLEVQHFLRKSVRSVSNVVSPAFKVAGLTLDARMVSDSLQPTAISKAALFNVQTSPSNLENYGPVPPMPSGGTVANTPSLNVSAIDVDVPADAVQRTPAPMMLRWFFGNALQAVQLLSTGEQIRSPAVPLAISLPGDASETTHPIICQLQIAGRPALNVLIPMPPGGPPPTITLITSETDPSTYRVGIRLYHATADLLTRYLTRGMFQEATESLTSDSMKAERLLEEKGHDPIAAAVGAYTILRAGDLSRLHEWTTNLMERFQWLPDGATICGEHLARLGKHKEAFSAFMQLQTRGLPFFADGLSYTIDRLRLYIETSSRSNSFSAIDLESGKSLLARLNSFATFTDFNRPLLTYTGSDPSSPDDQPSILPDSSSMSFGAGVSQAASLLAIPESAPMANVAPTNNDPQFVFNGINGATGEYLEPPKTARQIVNLALSDPAFSSTAAVANPNANHLTDLKRRTFLSGVEAYGVRFGVAPDSVKTAGWAVIFPRAADPSIVQALKPLLDLRKDQAGDLYHEFTGEKGFISGETKDQYLTRLGMGPGPADPTRVPYYLLIVADPETIPYQVQYQLDVQYAVGRIWFETLDEYARYAASVVLAETGKLALPRKAVMFGPQNPGDAATNLSSQQLVLPLAKLATTTGSTNGWQVETVIGPDATRANLAEYLGGSKTPALLFSASHGMGFPLGDSRQSAYQGALLCQDWPGPTFGGVDRSHYFAAEDVPDTARLSGLISFHFACYGAGTPKLDDFAHQDLRPPAAIAPNAFIAPLPRRLLGHPAGGALAVVGHVERAWGCSIVWNDAGRQIQAYEDAINVLMSGLPVGYALESINQRYADLSSSLSADLLAARSGTKDLDDIALAFEWTANNDARAHVIIGDPAVRLPLAAEGQPAAQRTTIGQIPQTQQLSIPMPPVDLPNPNPISDKPSEPQPPPPSSKQSESNLNSAQVTVTLPLKITVSVALGEQGIEAAAESAHMASGKSVPTGTQSFAIQIDPDYTDREGYDPTFLGTGTQNIPLPQLSAAQLADAATTNNGSGADRYELRYHHYSVVLNGKRRLAFFTAVNIDGKLAARPDRETDKWAYDPRVPRTSQIGDELYSSNPFDRGHLVRRLDPAWGRTDAIIKRANDDTFHFTNCSPQHERFNQGKNLWAGLEDYLLNKASDEDRRMTVFTGPIFTPADPKYRDVLIPKRFWKVAVVSRPNGQLASLGFIVDQEDLIRQVVSFDATSVAKTFQVPVRQIEQATGLNFGRLSELDAGSVDSFAIGISAGRELTSFEDIVLPKTPAGPTPAAAPSFAPASSSPLPPEAVAGTALRYYLVAFDENGKERDDHPAGIISRLVGQAVTAPTTTDVMLFSHGWQGDVKSAREQYGKWLSTMSANDADRAQAIKNRPGFNPVLVGIHWPSLPWGDERLGVDSFALPMAAPGPPSIAADVENYTAKMGDSPEARDRIRSPLRSVLEKIATATDNQATLPGDLRDAYRQLDGLLGLGAKGVAGDPTSDREPYDPEAIYQEFRASGLSSQPNNIATFGILPSKDALLAPLRALSYWKMKDRARTMGEGPVHDLLVQLLQLAAGRKIRFHLVGHSFGTIVASGAVAGPAGSAQLPQPVDSLILIQGAVSLWSYCANIPYAAGSAGYYHRLISEHRVRGPIVTTRSKYDTAVGTWYPLSSRVSGSVAFNSPMDFPKYGGIGSFGIQGSDLNAANLKMLNAASPYTLAANGNITNIEASDVICNGGGFSGAHSDICHPEVAHLVWSAMLS